MDSLLWVVIRDGLANGKSGEYRCDIGLTPMVPRRPMLPKWNSIEDWRQSFSIFLKLSSKRFGGEFKIGAAKSNGSSSLRSGRHWFVDRLIFIIHFAARRPADDSHSLIRGGRTTEMPARRVFIGTMEVSAQFGRDDFLVKSQGPAGGAERGFELPIGFQKYLFVGGILAGVALNALLREIPEKVQKLAAQPLSPVGMSDGAATF